jgi:hypothetical protein
MAKQAPPVLYVHAQSAAAPDPDLELITGQENIAAALGIGVIKLRQAIEDGAPVFRLANSDVVRRASLRDWLAERERAAVESRKAPQ